MSEQLKKTRRKLPPGPGRPKGCQNKNTTLLKDALLLAADQAGGKDGLVGYLKQQALKSPSAFLALLGKVLPLQLTGAGGGPIEMFDLSRLSNEQLGQLEALLNSGAVDRGSAGGDSPTTH